jgi:hypothetical protein
MFFDCAFSTDTSVVSRCSRILRYRLNRLLIVVLFWKSFVRAMTHVVTGSGANTYTVTQTSILDETLIVRTYNSTHYAEYFLDTIYFPIL